MIKLRPCANYPCNQLVIIPKWKCLKCWIKSFNENTYGDPKIYLP